MIRFGVRPMWAAPVLLLVAATSMLSESHFKCGSAQDPLFAIDGQIKGVATDSSWNGLSTNDIYWLQMVCVDPRDSTFRRGYGIPVISVWTTHGPASHLEPTLAAILEAQDANLRETSRYLRSVGEMDLPPRPAQVEVLMDVRESGWIATASVDRFLAKCYVFDGEIQAPHSRLSPRQPQCLDDLDLGS